MAKKRTARKQTTPANSTPAEKVRQYLGLLRKGKKAYREANRLLAQLQQEVGVGVEIDAGTSGTFEVVDQFEDTDIVFKPCGVSRYDLIQTY